jgi:hypothetical protein
VTGPGNAHSDTAGLYRLANGEEVVSDRFGQASRNRFLLKAINAGFTPSPAGSVRSQATPAADSSTRGDTTVQVDVHVSVLKNEDPRIVGNQVGRGVKEALAGVTL